MALKQSEHGFGQPAGMVSCASGLAAEFSGGKDASLSGKLAEGLADGRADRLLIPRPADSSALSEAGLALVRDEEGLSLVDGKMKIRGDFASMLPRLAPAKLARELLVRAAKIKGIDRTPQAVDATAGLGEDSLLLAAAGFEVLLFERNSVIAALLSDALERACADERLAPIVARMRVREGDSLEALRQLEGAPDVVLLDPMFPPKHKSSQVKKKLQLLQRLERPCEDEAGLLDAAFAAHPRKILVKRPVKGPYLASRKPDYSISGKAVRYDCFSLARNDAGGSKPVEDER